MKQREYQARWYREVGKARMQERLRDPQYRTMLARKRRSYRQRPESIELGKLQSRRRRARKFGIDEDKLTELESIQECQICEKPIIGWNHQIDHEHDTGFIRGVLCKDCNRGLGDFHDNTAALQTAIDYLATASAQRAYA